MEQRNWREWKPEHTAALLTPGTMDDAIDELMNRRGEMEEQESYDVGHVRPLPQALAGQPIQEGDYPIVEGKFGKMKPIKFEAEVKKVQTTVDGGIRLTLDLPEKARVVMSELAECQQNGVILAIEATKT